MKMCWLYNFMKYPEAIPAYKLYASQACLLGWWDDIGFDKRPSYTAYINRHVAVGKIPCYPLESTPK